MQVFKGFISSSRSEAGSSITLGAWSGCRSGSLWSDLGTTHSFLFFSKNIAHLLAFRARATWKSDHPYILSLVSPSTKHKLSSWFMTKPRLSFWYYSKMLEIEMWSSLLRCLKTSQSILYLYSLLNTFSRTGFLFPFWNSLVSIRPPLGLTASLFVDAD